MNTIVTVAVIVISVVLMGVIVSNLADYDQVIVKKSDLDDNEELNHKRA